MFPLMGGAKSSRHRAGAPCTAADSPAASTTASPSSSSSASTSFPSCRIHPSYPTSTIVLLLLLLVSCLVLQWGPRCASAQEVRSPGGKPYKFMRWGKRFYDNQEWTSKVTTDDGTVVDELEDLIVPVFGSGSVLCKNIAPGGIYKCAMYRSPKSDTLFGQN